MAVRREMPTQPESANEKKRLFCFIIWMKMPITTNEAEPSSSPFKNPIRISLNINPSFCIAEMSSSIRTRMVTASDWVPTLPAMSRIIDWKQIRSAIRSTIGSKMPTTEETPMPRKSSSTSHGRRFFKLCNSGSCRSSSEVRPASFA